MKELIEQIKGEIEDLTEQKDTKIELTIRMFEKPKRTKDEAIHIAQLLKERYAGESEFTTCDNTHWIDFYSGVTKVVIHYTPSNDEAIEAYKAKIRELEGLV